MNKNSVFGFGLVCFAALVGGCTLSKETGTTTTTTSSTGGEGGSPAVNCDIDNDTHTDMRDPRCKDTGDNLDCDDLDSSVHPGADEICGDGVDNNCDGHVDENCQCLNGATQSCYTGSINTRNVGMCHDGMQTCSNGFWGACLGSVTPISEVCGNGIDENCDGQVNENCGCQNGATQACYTGPANTRGVGTCHDGSQTCSNGSWGACLGSITPTAEVCGDGKDNSCNGQIDDGCGNGLIDNDGDGYYANDPNPALVDCDDGNPAVHPGAAEICDSIDNNCVNGVDEGNVCNSGGMPVTVCFHLTPPAGTNLNVAQMNWWSPNEDDCILTVFDGQNHVACPATYYAGTLVVFSPDAMADGIFYHPFDTCGAPPGTLAIGSVWVTKGECADNGPGIWNTTTGPWQDNPDNLPCTRNGYFIAPNP